jgi:hypothetical protein
MRDLIPEYSPPLTPPFSLSETRDIRIHLTNLRLYLLLINIYKRFI